MMRRKDIIAWLKANQPLGDQPMEPRPSIAEIQRRIGLWSGDNFGQQVSQHTQARLGATAPLMGLAEEFGEFACATSVDLATDALADIGSYLLDFATRDGAAVGDLTAVAEGCKPWPPEFPADLDPVMGMAAGIGRITHAHLKRHQGIREMADVAVYELTRDGGIAILWHYLAECARSYGREINELIFETFTEHVGERDWRSAPETGVES